MNNQQPHAKSLRKGRVSASGNIYLVTSVSLNRQPVFLDLYIARKVVCSLYASDQIDRTKTLAFVLMPDHLHWMVQLGSGFSLSRVVRDVKSISAHHVGRPIWQAGFYDHAVRREEDLLRMARYVVANPLRAGLVKDIGMYPHWDADWL